MKRLSDTAIAIINELHTERLDYQSEYLPLIDAASKLDAYEGTGLDPKDIRQMFNEGIILKLAAQFLGTTPDHLCELVHAEKECRLVVLPQIKKYRTLYWLWGDEIMPVRYWGIRGGCEKDGTFHITCEMRTKKDRTFSGTHKEYTYKKGDCRFFYADDLGRTVFLTRKEAVAALEGAHDAES